jgi:U3 small nucleolar RNA-associated protein 19
MAVSSSLPVKRQKTAEVKSHLKARKASTSQRTHFEDELDSIEQALSSSSDLNPLFNLVQLLQSKTQAGPSGSDSATLQKGIKFLVRSLQVLLQDHRIPLTQVNEKGLVQGTFREDAGLTEADRAVADWLRQRWNESIQLLCAALLSSDEGVRVSEATMSSPIIC